ncbi:MAG: hypothetical protein IPK82_30150 [Polyangiaceae bacterium]|nr:hypothetical protein [Polyangiaceae bacterium]
MVTVSDIPGRNDKATLLGCHHGPDDKLRELGLPPDKASQHLGFFACEPAVEVVPGKKHFCLSGQMDIRRTKLEGGGPEITYVCASSSQGRVEGLRFYHEKSFAQRETGNVDNGQCPPHPH